MKCVNCGYEITLKQVEEGEGYHCDQGYIHGDCIHDFYSISFIDEDEIESGGSDD